MADKESVEAEAAAYPALDHLLACEDWDGKADCVYRGEDPDDWCDACTARVEEIPRFRAQIRRAAIEEAIGVVKDTEVGYGTDAEGAGGQDFTDAIAAEAALHEVGRKLRSLLGGEK